MNKQQRQTQRLENRIQTATILGLVVLGFAYPSPTLFAATLQPVEESAIVVHQPDVELANPFKLGLPRSIATKMAQFRMYRNMLENDDMSRLDPSVVIEMQFKLESVRDHIVAVLPIYDLTEDASMYLAVALAEDPAQHVTRHARTFGLIRQLMSRPMSKVNKAFVSQLKGYLVNQISQVNKAS